MFDFVKELIACRVEGTQFPFYPEKVQGYSEQEVELIAEKCNLDIHGQFREFLLQMGRCSGGLLLGDEFAIYNNNWSLNDFYNYQTLAKVDDGFMLTEFGEMDPVQEKVFFLSTECETYYHYLLTAENDDYVWLQHDDGDGEGEILKKTNSTLLEYFKQYVENKTKMTRFIDFELTEEQMDSLITGKLL